MRKGVEGLNCETLLQLRVVSKSRGRKRGLSRYVDTYILNVSRFRNLEG